MTRGGERRAGPRARVSPRPAPGRAGSPPASPRSARIAPTSVFYPHIRACSINTLTPPRPQGLAGCSPVGPSITWLGLTWQGRHPEAAHLSRPYLAGLPSAGGGTSTGRSHLLESHLAEPHLAETPLPGLSWEDLA